MSLILFITDLKGSPHLHERQVVCCSWFCNHSSQCKGSGSFIRKATLVIYLPEDRDLEKKVQNCGTSAHHLMVVEHRINYNMHETLRRR
ncbi:unnamed protein product [Cochlearia groenlandica]